MCLNFASDFQMRPSGCFIRISLQMEEICFGVKRYKDVLRNSGVFFFSADGFCTQQIKQDVGLVAQPVCMDVRW